MKEPVLVIMAAGMGSRYGGLKQIDPIDGQGHLIIDFSIYDAKKAGFKSIVFIIKQEMEEEFKEVIGNRISGEVKVSYVYQRLENIPQGFAVPEGRVKPWGTGHAVLSCLGAVDAPFAVINADDYYGAHAFSAIYDFLASREMDTASVENTALREGEKYHYAMVGYLLENTLTEHGHVARGICEITEEGYLCGIQERTRIEKFGEEVKYTEDGGESWTPIPPGSTVSMNIWGFYPSILGELETRFKRFLEQEASGNPLKAEFFLPTVVGELLKEGQADVRVLKSVDKWYGVTYKEDKEAVIKALAELKVRGSYPDEF
ncbi:NDP-sugar pyrophosphorylase family protein [Anaerotaenia torta]|uniref:nucleotidyltransferase family protein n=1 Tax=Anaerotaenia torta TaxID=433293 RepID=UPI003D1AA8B5